MPVYLSEQLLFLPDAKQCASAHLTSVVAGDGFVGAIIVGYYFAAGDEVEVGIGVVWGYGQGLGGF